MAKSKKQSFADKYRGGKGVVNKKPQPNQKRDKKDPPKKEMSVAEATRKAIQQQGRTKDLFGREQDYVSVLKKEGIGYNDIKEIRKAGNNTQLAAKNFYKNILNKQIAANPIDPNLLQRMTDYEVPEDEQGKPLFDSYRRVGQGDKPLFKNPLADSRYLSGVGSMIPNTRNKFLQYGADAVVGAPGFTQISRGVMDKIAGGSGDYTAAQRYFKNYYPDDQQKVNQLALASLDNQFQQDIFKNPVFEASQNYDSARTGIGGGIPSIYSNKPDTRTVDNSGNDGGGSGGSSGSTTQQPFDSTNMITYFDPNQGKYISGTFQDYQKVVQVKDGGIIGYAEGGPIDEMSIPDLNSFRQGQVMSNPGGMPYMNPETGEMFSSQDLKEDLDDANRLLPDSGIAKLLQRLQTEGDIAAGNNKSDQFLRNGIGLFYNKNTKQNEVHDMSNSESIDMLMKGILERIDETLPEEQQMFGPSLEAGYRSVEDFSIPQAPNTMSSEPGITSIPGADRVIEGTTMEDVNIPTDMRPGTETNDPMLMFPENPNRQEIDPSRQEMLFASEPQQAGEGIGSIIIDAIRRSVENGSMTPRQGEIAIQNMLESMGPKQIDLFTGARGGIASLASGGMGNRQDIEAAESLMFKDPEQNQEWEFNI